MKPSEVIRKTKETLFERGWYKGGLQDPYTHNVCVLGAMALTLGQSLDNGYSTAIMSATVRRKTSALARLDIAYDQWAGDHDRPFEAGVICFNDAESTTFDDLCDVLDLAEKEAERDER